MRRALRIRIASLKFNRHLAALTSSTASRNRRRRCGAIFLLHPIALCLDANVYLRLLREPALVILSSTFPLCVSSSVVDRVSFGEQCTQHTPRAIARNENVREHSLLFDEKNRSAEGKSIVCAFAARVKDKATNGARWKSTERISLFSRSARAENPLRHRLSNACIRDLCGGAGVCVRSAAAAACVRDLLRCASETIKRSILRWPGRRPSSSFRSSSRRCLNMLRVCLRMENVETFSNSLFLADRIGEERT